MDENEKKFLENLRNFNTSKLYFQESYVDFEYKESLYPSYISEVESDTKYKIYIPNNNNYIVFPKNMLKYYGENDHFENNKLRELCLNPNLINEETRKIMNQINFNLKEYNMALPDDINELENNEKELDFISFSSNEKANKKLIKDEKGNDVNIIGYFTFQLLDGTLNDCLSLIRDNLTRSHSLNFDDKELFSLIMNIIIFCANVVKNNLKYYKTAYYNRKLLIVSQIHAILVSFDSLISNLTPFYKYIGNSNVDLYKTMKKILNSVYQLVLQSKELNSIPLQSLIIFIKLITLPQANGNIENYNKNELYLILKEHMNNLDKNELIFFKSDSSIKEICNSLINQLFNDKNDEYINEIYLSYLFSCIKCDNLEKKINAINEMNNVINKDFIKSEKINTIFKEFIDKNNILDMFLDDNTHEEITKRAGDLFKYLAKFNCLNDNILDKLIEKQKKNSLMTDILIEIISGLSMDKKDTLFKRLTQGLKLDDTNSNNIDYISKLTVSCFDFTKKEVFTNEKETDEKMVEEEKTEYYGLNIFFDYVLFNFDDKKNYEESNVDKTINTFASTIEDIIDNNSLFGINDINYFLDKLLENIKSNEKHNSTIQSIKLIRKLLNIIETELRDNADDILKILDKKYDIITLLIDDLVRYLNILEDNHSDKEIYEGIYPHSINIEERLNLIFYFLKNNYNSMAQGKKHLEKIYHILKPEKYTEEKKKFYEIVSKSIGKLDNDFLTEFYTDVLQNKEEIDLTKINDKESINLILNIFKQINLNKSSILNDGRKLRVEENAEIEGLDMLFTLLTKNPDDYIQERVSEFLCQICLYHKNYASDLLSNYWIEFFNKINVFLDEIMKTNDKIMLNGTLKLIDKIYKKCDNMEGNVMGKNDYKSPKKYFKEFHFMLDSKHQFKLKAGLKDKFVELRYKISYFFDIPVNNVCLVDLYGNEYNLNNDFDNFLTLFNSEKYFYKKGFEYIGVKVVPFEIWRMKDNPKQLIEKNEKIYNILINNLKVDSAENDSGFLDKEKIWSILMQLPKLFYFENNLGKYGEKEKIEEQELSKIFNINNIYIFTYYLQCIYIFLGKKDKSDESKQQYLNNFIEIHHIDNLIIDNLLNISPDFNNCKTVKYDCLTSLLNIMMKIEEYKKNRNEYEGKRIINQNDLMNSIFQKFTDIISILIKLDSISNENNDIDLDINLDKYILYLGKIIVRFIKYISNEKNNYMNFIFKNPDSFISIFVKDFIKCDSDELKEVIEEFLSDNFKDNSEIFLDYLKIILTEELLDYLIKNDRLGNYFNVISSSIKKYFEKKENKEFESSKYPELISNLKKIVDRIIDFINQQEKKLEEKKELENKNHEIIEINNNNKIYESFKEEMFLFLSNIISLQPYDLVQYIINKIDIVDFFLIKCNLRKCVEKPLETPDAFCSKNQSKLSVVKLLMNILRNSDNENQIKIYYKIIDILDNLNKTGFWKTYNVQNWEIEYEEMPKTKYIGLKNMTSTCYLNSIVQQLYMIPTFRETIIKIDNPSKNNILYELQLLFSALKIYENPYYDPKSFVIANNVSFTEQMDAYEFYGTLIDKIEKDIKDIYCPKIDDKNWEAKKDNYKYKDIFNYFFGIKVLDELQFVDCGHKRYNEFCYYNIQIEIKNFNNIYDSLNNYFKAEVMDGDNKINCEECKTKRICHKRLLLKSLPNILVISLKRFEFDYETMFKLKLNKYFEFPFQLNMKDYMMENHTEECTEYDLTGIVIHNGEADFGHYYDLIKGSDNNWYKFNDENITEFKEENIPNEAFGNKDDDDDSEKERGNIKRNAYILFYTKKCTNKKEELEKYDLSLPPYDRESNIKKEIREEINLKLYKSWIIKNIFTTWYQQLVLGLFKINYNKNLYLSRGKNHIENYEEEKKDNNDMIEEEHENNFDEMDDKCFKFFIRYYYNVVSRITKRGVDKTIVDLRKRFQELLTNYIFSDFNKMKYILEEFTNKEVIEEYLIYCSSRADLHFFGDFIKNISIRVYQNSDMNDKNCFFYLFYNTLMTYAANNIAEKSLDRVNDIILHIININPSLFLSHLKEKRVGYWILALCRSDSVRETFNDVFSEENMPKFHSAHSILSEKTIEPEEKYENLMKKGMEDIKDLLDMQFINGLGDMQSNNHLLNELRKYL